MKDLALKLGIAVVAALILLAAYTLVADPTGRTALVGLAAALVGWIVPAPGKTTPIAALVLAGALVTPGCSSFQWPKTLDTVKDCAPSPKPLIDQVFAILSRDGFDGEAMQELAELGAREGGTVILCIVTQLVNELVAATPEGDKPSLVAVNGRRFLEATKTEIK